MARRGSPTAAAAAGVLASPRPGHAPFLVCPTGGGEIVRPATIVVNKSTISGERLGRITWGAAQLGIAQGVLDALADGVLDPADADDLVLLVALWVDPDASDETAVREANRAAMRAALADAVAPVAPDAVRELVARREDVGNAFYAGRLMRIASVEVRRYARPLDPPFRAAWDPVPRTRVEAELAIVRSDDGLAGYASGDRLPDAALLSGLLAGLDPRRTEVVRELCETVDFHGARPWIAEVAVWDLAARALGEPLWRLLGGRSERLLAYASSGELVAPEERARRVAALRDAGVRAVKLRFHHADWRDDVAVVEAVRDAVGGGVELMVDANQGWRMAGDRSARWDVATAAQCARALEPLGVYWLEEPLRTDDVEGYAALRRLTTLRIAAGEMVRGAAEARDLLLRGGVDVIQPDVVLSGGLGGCRRIAALADLCGRAFSPHTWSNGLGLVANLHLALAVSTCPYVEVPCDPPAWTAERRDWLLPAPVEIAADGTIAPPPGPGLGVEPDLEALERWRVA